MVANANAVIHPGTVVVEPFHAPLAYCAMTRSWRPDYLTVGTELGKILVYLYYLSELNIGPKVAWISEVHENEKHDRLESEADNELGESLAEPCSHESSFSSLTVIENSPHEKVGVGVHHSVVYHHLVALQSASRWRL